jgi:predicted lipoprotein with Yx(FWY)xxD motif
VNRKLYGWSVLAAVIAALALAACGGGSSTSGSETSSGTENASSGGRGYGNEGSEGEAAQAAPNAEEGTTFVSLGNVSGLGMVLVDSQGMTLYDFRKDKGTVSSCYGACEGFWPPLLTEGEAQPSNGAMASKLGTTERRDGKMQVTYAGHPLYTFIEDVEPGEATGNNLDKFGGEWYALNKEGEEPTTTEGATSEGSTTTSSGGGGSYSGY